MIPIPFRSKSALASLVGAALAMNVALADKPEWAGGGDKGGKGHSGQRHDEQRSERHDEQRSERHDDGGHNGRGDAPQRTHFEERHTVVVRDYYSHQMRGGHCPPGLAKKHNGCMPPGQARKWDIGHRLPPDVVYYAVPQPLVTQIGPPPSGYRYVRVASDILMIAIGSGMVVDAIKDLGRS
jgi:Ni/Co efflux regulator RcnB